MHVIFYDKLKRNPNEEYAKIAKFLKVQATPTQIEKVRVVEIYKKKSGVKYIKRNQLRSRCILLQIVHHTSFAEMKKRDDNVIPKEDSKVRMKADIMEKDGGFFRKGLPVISLKYFFFIGRTLEMMK